MNRLFLSLSCSLALGAHVHAQFGSPRGGAADLLPRFFEGIEAFTADVEMRTLGKDGNEVMSVPSRMSMLDGKTRLEMDMGRTKAPGMIGQMAPMMKAVGMDQMVAIMLPKEEITYVIVPGAKSYTENKLKPEQATNLTAKLDKTEMGKETVDGIACVKSRVSFNDAKGKAREAFVWQATDLKNFPLKVEVPERSTTTIFQFKKPSFDKPAAKLFTAPEGFTKYSDPEEMKQALMMKMMSGGGGGGLPGGLPKAPSGQ